MRCALKMNYRYPSVKILVAIFFLIVIIRLLFNNSPIQYELNLRKQVMDIFTNDIKRGQSPHCEGTDLKVPRKIIIPASYVTDKCTSPVLLMDGRGRLGNRVCAYLTVVLLQKLFGYRAVLSEELHSNVSTIFKTVNIPIYPDECREELNMTQLNHDDIKALFRKEFLQNPSRHSAEDLITSPSEIYNYPCDSEELLTYRHIILDELELSEGSIELAKDFRNKLYKMYNIDESKHHTTVGVHIRRGDYEEYLHDFKNSSRNFATTCYLKEAMDFFRDRYKNLLFVVTGNSMEWNKENMSPLSIYNDVIFSDSTVDDPPLLDMLLLAHCDHNIVTLGTYGFLTVLLGNHGIAVHTLVKNKELRQIEWSFVCQNSSSYIGIPDCGDEA